MTGLARFHCTITVPSILCVTSSHEPEQVQLIQLQKDAIKKKIKQCTGYSYSRLDDYNFRLVPNGVIGIKQRFY